MRVAIFALLLGSVLQAADDPDHTAGALNGRAWSKMGTPMRSAYLQGAYEGDGLCRVIANATIGWPTSLTFEEIEQALDLFYKEPTNASIPVLIGGVYYVKRKAEGASEAELKQLEVDLRKRSH